MTELLSIEDAASFCGCSYRTLQRGVAAGGDTLIATRIGKGRVMFTARDLENYIQSRRGPALGSRHVRPTSRSNADKKRASGAVTPEALNVLNLN